MVSTKRRKFSKNLKKNQENGNTDTSEGKFSDHVSEDILRILMENEKTEPDISEICKKEIIKDIIKNEIVGFENFGKEDLLNKIKNSIQKKFSTQLSSIDHDYVNRKYAKYCLKLWLEEATTSLGKLAENKDLEDICDMLDSVRNFQEIPKPLNEQKYYKLVLNAGSLITEEDKNHLVTLFKSKCLEQIATYNDSENYNNELEFIESFIKFLNSNLICDELPLDKFCNKDITFNQLLDSIINLNRSNYNEELPNLQKIANTLQKQKGLLFVNKFRKIITEYKKPIEIKEIEVDNRKIIEVIGKKIIIKDVLNQLLNMVENVDEVRFVGADVIHINADLQNDIWHGKNIVIVAKEMKIYDKITWNISGKDNTLCYENDAGRNSDGSGKSGSDGHRGESGGNALILTEKIENEKNFTIISNGGAGSNGQNGGSGEDGKTGKGITSKEFYEKFPETFATKVAALRPPKLRQILQSIKKDSVETKSLWYESWRDTKCSTLNEALSDFDAHYSGGIQTAFNGNFFINTTTEDGKEIIFSYHSGTWYTAYTCQGFLIYKGSFGSTGKSGGQHGLGGQGGYPGEIIIENSKSGNTKFDVNINAAQGKDGDNGNSGSHGKDGKNGWDMGYIDCNLWFSTGVYGEMEDRVLSVVYYDSNTTERVWCGHRSEYAEITTSKIEHPKSKNHDEKTKDRENNERQDHAQATKKKAISQNSMLAKYSNKSSNLQNLRNEINTSKQQALGILAKGKTDSKSNEIRQVFHRHIVNPDKLKTKSNTEDSSFDLKNDIRENKLTYHMEELSNISDDNSNSKLDEWLRLQNQQIEIEELNQLFSSFEKLKHRSNFEKLKDKFLKTNKNKDVFKYIEKFLTEKYRFAILGEISKQPKLSNEHKTAEDISELTPEKAARYLSKMKENSEILHENLGNLHDYFNRDGEKPRKMIIDFYKKKLKSSTKDRNGMQQFIKLFILENGNLEDSPANIKMYYNEYEIFLEEKTLKLQECFDLFKSELSHPRHSSISKLWRQKDYSYSIKMKMEQEIEKDKFLKFLYGNVIAQQKIDYDWKNCYEDEIVLKEFFNYIEKKGIKSRSYREFLSHVFNVNIRFYVQGQDNQLYLLDDYNIASKNHIYMLFEGSRFSQMNINESYLSLENERQNLCDSYSQIILETNDFSQKKQLDEYFNKKMYMKMNKSLKTAPHYKEELFNDNQHIKDILQYFTDEEEKQKMKLRLEKITFKCIGREGILHDISKRFRNEGRHITFQELCYLVNAILDFVLGERDELLMFRWIILSSSQRNWVREVLFLQFENFFKMPMNNKANWKSYLLNIVDINSLILLKTKLRYQQNRHVSIECIENILFLLNSLNSSIDSLKNLEISEWPYAIKKEYWLMKLMKLTSWHKDEKKLQFASHYLRSLENTAGTTVIEILLSILSENKPISMEDVLYVLHLFYKERRELNKEILKDISKIGLKSWIEKSKVGKSTTDDKKELNISQLVTLIQNHGNTSSGILENLPAIETIVKDEYKTTCEWLGKSVKDFTENDITEWTKTYLKHIEEREEIQIYQDILSVVNRAIELKRGFKLRDTQKLTILALLLNDRSLLAQVNTGEGKSLIIVATSIIKGMRGGIVDIVTSSSVLAKRDSEEHKDIYKLFNISVSNNCDENIENRKMAYSNSKVIYGELSNYQRDYLLDRFYGQNILGDRNFRNILVDEVDSMLLDKGNHMLYLSHGLPDLDKLNTVYVFIWRWLNKPANNFEDILDVFDVETIKNAILYDIFGIIEKEDLHMIDPDLTENDMNTLWEILIKAKIINDEGKFLLLEENTNLDRLERILPLKYSSIYGRLQHFLKNILERDRAILIPNNLRSFVEDHLERWIDSAIKAFFLRPGVDYVVDVDRTGICVDRNPKIIALDKDTGTDQVNSQWDEALHQFLQLKHGCKISWQSLKAVFISNISYFKLYSRLYGLTGSLGSHRERDLLKEVYNVDFVTIPTAKMKKFTEEDSIICSNEDKWIEVIKSKSIDLITNKRRSVLIICETIENVNKLYNAFDKEYTKFIHTYTRDYEEFGVAKGNECLKSGEIIIATNLAGRGTDIKITPDLEKAGGLHICLTYLPNNSRIEEQAFGRAARCGNKGSGQLIIVNSKIKNDDLDNIKILELKDNRDDEELYRISDIRTFYETHIKTEEKAFKRFTEIFNEKSSELTTKLKEVENGNDMKKILLDSCLDSWAFWLDENSKYLEDAKNENAENLFYDSLNKFLSNIRNLPVDNIKTYSLWVNNNPIQMIKLGTCFLKKRDNYDLALELFEKLIQQEPHHSEAAHYYKAFLVGKKVNWKSCLRDGNFEKEMRESVRIFEKRIESCTNAKSFIGHLKKTNKSSILQIEAFEKQQEDMCNLYRIFIHSLNSLFDQPVTSQSFMNIRVNEQLSEIIYEDLLKAKLLRKAGISEKIPKDKVKQISFEYGIKNDQLNTFLSGRKQKEIDEKEFVKELKKVIQLPSREEFWKLLVSKKILKDEVKYVTIDETKLEKINPSLLALITEKVNKHFLEELSFDDNANKQIILRMEINDTKKKTKIFKKYSLKQELNERKYSYLKKNGVITANKRATIDLEKLKSPIDFPSYDSLTLEDFISREIPVKDAESILNCLFEKKVLEKDTSDNKRFRLKVNYHEIDFKALPKSYAIYRNAIRSSLYSSFIYRISLQKLEIAMKEEDSPIYIRLPSKPHEELVLELLEKKAITPVTVPKDTASVKSGLNGMYGKLFTKENLQARILDLTTEPCGDDLFARLIEMNWISQVYIIHLEYYSINKPDERKECAKSENSNLETMKIVLNYLFELSEGKVIDDICDTVNELTGKLRTLDAPDLNLKPFREACGHNKYECFEEIVLFYHYGLDSIIEPGEKKWTMKMLISTGFIIAFGIAQLAAGIYIQLYSIGAMTHVGQGFISEGISDIIYGIGALRSGYFSWKDYARHKMLSLLITTFSVGVGAYISRGTKFSYFGHKLQGEGLEVAGQTVSEMYGKQLIDVAGKQVRNAVIKRIMLKTVEGVAFGIGNAAVDTAIENYFRSQCQNISSTILGNIDKTMDEHGISSNVEKLYDILGEKLAKEALYDMASTKSNNAFSEILTYVNKIGGSIMQGVAQAAEKFNRAGDSKEWPIRVIGKIITISVHTLHVCNISNTVDSHLNDLNKEIKEKIDKYQKETPRTDHPEEENKENREKFRREIIQHWKSLLRERISRIITEHIVNPVLQYGMNKLLVHTGKRIKNVYQCCKENLLYKQFEERKEKYEDEIRDLEEQESSDNESKTVLKNKITEQYHNDLLKLMTKTKNPKLMSDIIRENVPMDTTCVKACMQVFLKRYGISGTIIIKSKDGLCQKFSSTTDGSTGDFTINLDLDNNHFKISNENEQSSDGSKSDEIKNDCLYDALIKAFPKLGNMTPETFREDIANCIENDPEIQYYIQQGWHRLPIHCGAYGGSSKKSSEPDDKTSEPGDNTSEIITMSTSELYDKIISEEILFSQSSIADHTSGFGDEKQMYIGELSEEISKEWKGKPIRAVLINGKIVLLDHRRAIASAILKSKDVKIKLKVTDQQDEFSSETCEKQYKTRDAGEAVQKRMRSGSLDDISDIGFTSSKVRIRTRKVEEPHPSKDNVENTLKEMNFIIGSRKRSKSIDSSNTINPKHKKE